MQVVKGASEMQGIAEALRREGKRIGVVPTMGFLHEGHLSLIRLAKERSDVVVTTVFVNPAQFAPDEDFERYPRDPERDARLAQSAGSTIFFLPDGKEMYPEGYLTYVGVERMTSLLEGKFRPAHFRGVTTVVAKLFNLTRPHVALFGQKDAQQAAVIRRMALDLNFGVEIVTGPIVREPDGLAMSSRNIYLSSEHRAQAAVLFRSLRLAGELIAKGERDRAAVTQAMLKLIHSVPAASVDYISLADPLTLEEAGPLGSGTPVLVSLAVRLGGVRLIDNVVVQVP